MKFKNVSPFRLGILGTLCYAGSVAWVVVSQYLAHHSDPPGWIIEHPTPIGAYYLAAFGACLVLCASVWRTLRMKKPTMQITERVGGIPVAATCSSCPGTRFRVGGEIDEHVRDSESVLQVLFDHHFRTVHLRENTDK